MDVGQVVTWLDEQLMKMTNYTTNSINLKITFECIFENQPAVFSQVNLSHGKALDN